MKKIALLLISVLMVCSLAACGDSDKGTKKESNNASSPSKEDPTPVVTEEAKLSDEITQIGETPLGIKLPTNYKYNDGWSCYSNEDYTMSIWLKDARPYDTKESITSSYEDYGKTVRMEKYGNFEVAIEENELFFYGPSTFFYVYFDQPIAGKAGLKFTVTCTAKDEDGNFLSTNIATTQSDIIKAMIASICEK